MGMLSPKNSGDYRLSIILKLDEFGRPNLIINGCDNHAHTWSFWSHPVHCVAETFAATSWLPLWLLLSGLPSFAGRAPLGFPKPPPLSAFCWFFSMCRKRVHSFRTSELGWMDRRCVNSSRRLMELELKWKLSRGFYKYLYETAIVVLAFVVVSLCDTLKWF